MAPDLRRRRGHRLLIAKGAREEDVDHRTRRRVVRRHGLGAKDYDLVPAAQGNGRVPVHDQRRWPEVQPDG